QRPSFERTVMFWPDFTLSSTEPCSPGRLYSLVCWFVLTFSAWTGRGEKTARTIPTRITALTLMRSLLYKLRARAASGETRTIAGSCGTCRLPWWDSRSHGGIQTRPAVEG